MIYNVLLASKKISEIEALKDVLEKNLAVNKDVTFEIECVKNIEDKFNLIEQNYYNLILSDFSQLALQTFKIFTFQLSARIYALKENKKHDEVFEETVLRGAFPLIQKTFDHEKIAEFLIPKIEESKFSDSYTNRLIESMVQLESTEDIANIMISYGRTVCRQYDIQGLNQSDMMRVLYIFSISIKNRSLLKTIRFFERMRIATELLDLLHASLEPYKVEGFILHTIYQHTKMEIMNLSHDQCCSTLIPEEIHGNIVETIKQHKVFIEKGLDLDHIWVRLIDTLNQTETEQAVYDSFLQNAIKLARYIICYTKGGVVTIETPENHLLFNIQTIKGMDKDDILSIFDKKSAIDEHITLEIDENRVTLSIDTNVLKKSKPSLEDESKYVPHKHDRIFISAYDYMNRIDDPEAVADMVEVLEDYENLAERSIAETKSVSKASLETVADLISKYSVFLNLQTNEFKELSYVLATLTSILKNADAHKIESNKEAIYIILTSIIDDLRSWKNNIFVTKIAKDIHYLDDSLYSSCLQLEKILNDLNSDDATEEGMNDDDLELF